MRNVTDQRLNNAQRKALAEIIEKRINGRLELARQNEAKLQQQLTAEIAQHFKIDAIKVEILRLQKLQKNLERRLEEIGFDQDYQGNLLIARGAAQKLLKVKLESRSLAIRSLEGVRDVLKQRVWLAQTVEDVKRVSEDLDELGQ